MNMTDIVERLRRLPPSPIAFGDSEANKRNRAERGEAADEIERLRAEIERETGRAETAIETLNETRDELERLRSET